MKNKRMNKRMTFSASPGTTKRTGIAYYEVHENGRAAAFDHKGRKLVEITATHGKAENLFSLRTSSGQLKMRYHLHTDKNELVVQGEANGAPLSLRVRTEKPAFVGPKRLPKIDSDTSDLARSMLRDIERKLMEGTTHLGTVQPTKSQSRPIVFASTGHFAHCSLAAIELGLSIFFVHPLGIAFGALGMAACAIWS